MKLLREIIHILFDIYKIFLFLLWNTKWLKRTIKQPSPQEKPKPNKLTKNLKQSPLPKNTKPQTLTPLTKTQSKTNKPTTLVTSGIFPKLFSVLSSQKLSNHAFKYGSIKIFTLIFTFLFARPKSKDHLVTRVKQSL